MRRNDLEQPNRRKALKIIGSAGLATVGFSGSALANESGSISENPGKIRIVTNSNRKIVMVTEYEGEQLRISYFKQGPNAGEIHYEGGPQWLDGFQFDVAAARSKSSEISTQGVTTASNPLVERQSRFRKKIGGCHVFNNYQHRFSGGSVVLSKNVSILGQETLGAIIGSVIPGGKIGIAVGIIAGFIISKFSGRKFTFGQRDFDQFGIEFSVSAAGAGFNVPASKTIPVTAPIPDHIAH